MANRVAEAVSDLGEKARERRMESRLDKVDRENDRLKHEVKLLREDLHEERGSLQQALDALKRDEHVTVQTKAPKRRGRLLRAAVIGGGAYLLGARAGRERYEQIVQKARDWKRAAMHENGSESSSSMTRSSGSDIG